MKNQSRIIYPKCGVCGRPIEIGDIPCDALSDRRVLLISGTAGAGKSALGQLIEQKHSWVFIDGDAVSKRMKHCAKTGPSVRTQGGDCHDETIRTTLVVAALGYDVVAGYVIGPDTRARYVSAFAERGAMSVFRVLVPERSVCLRRDADRECWTAGEYWIDLWYEQQRGYLTTDPAVCVDSSNETLEQTYHLHFKELLT